MTRSNSVAIQALGFKGFVSSALELRLRCVQGRTVQRGLPPVLSCGVPLLGPLPVSVAMVAVAPVRPPAQGNVDPDVQSAVACGATRNTLMRNKSLVCMMVTGSDSEERWSEKC